MIKRQHIGENQNRSSILAKQEGCYINDHVLSITFTFSINSDIEIIYVL